MKLERERAGNDLQEQGRSVVESKQEDNVLKQNLIYEVKRSLFGILI